MKNLIFLCIFHNYGYIKLLNLLLESLYVYGNLQDNTEILIYTNSEFSKIIQENTLLADKISYHINDEYVSVKSACKARYDFFTIPDIADYNNVLYLDVDIIVKGDINVLFDTIIEREKVYVVEEGDIVQGCDYWGHPLFTEEEIDRFEDKSAFSSGVILFRNCEVINTLFEKIKRDMIDRDQHFSTVDQPFFVYNAMKYKLYDNKKLKKYLIDFRTVKQIDKISETSGTLIHYCNEIGLHQDKYNNMLQTLDELKKNKNLIFLSLFYDDDFEYIIDTLNNLLLKDNLNFSTHVLIYTSNVFCKAIKECLQKQMYFPINHKNYINFVSKIHFEINDNYGTPLDIFDSIITKNYKKILYISANYILNKPITQVFNLIEKDLVYMTSNADEISTDIMLFKNSEKIKKMFDIIKFDIITRKLTYNEIGDCVINSLKKFRLVDSKRLGDFC